MLLSHLFKSPSVVRWNDIIILWRITRNHKSPKTINCDFICPKSFNFSCITMSQASNFPKCNAFFFDLNQGFTTIKHWIIKPSPWAWLIISKLKKNYQIFDSASLQFWSIWKRIYSYAIYYLSMFFQGLLLGHLRPWQGWQVHSRQALTGFDSKILIWKTNSWSLLQVPQWTVAEAFHEEWYNYPQNKSNKKIQKLRERKRNK